MQFGYFDDAAKEYVITRPDTPRPWANYLGTTEYGAIITNNAGGYSFYRSASNGRFLRLRSNAVPLDQPGRYFYLRDRDNGDFWSASWQPVGKSLEQLRKPFADTAPPTQSSPRNTTASKPNRLISCS